MTYDLAKFMLAGNSVAPASGAALVGSYGITQADTADVPLAKNASKFLLFLMSEQEVEDRVGDLLEQLARIQEKHGRKFGIVHFWWTVLCLAMTVGLLFLAVGRDRLNALFESEPLPNYG